MQTIFKEKLIKFQPPILAIILGAPGAGKTTLCRGFQKKGVKGLIDFIDIYYINKDQIGDFFTTEQGKLYDDFRSIIYKIIDNDAEEKLYLGKSVLIDATYATELHDNWTERYKKMAKKHGVKLKIIYCTVREDVLKRRIKKRDLERDRDKLASEKSWREFLEKERLVSPIPFECLELDRSSDYSLTKNVHDVIEFLQKP